MEHSEAIFQDPMIMRTLDAVAAHFHINRNYICSPRRSRSLLVPRWTVMYLIRELTRLSYPEIGSLFGFDHSSVMYACRRVRRLCECDDGVRRDVQYLLGELNSQDSELCTHKLRVHEFARVREVNGVPMVWGIAPISTKYRPSRTAA